MANAMKGVTKALTKMNKQTSLPGLQQLLLFLQFLIIMDVIVQLLI